MQAKFLLVLIVVFLGGCGHRAGTFRLVTPISGLATLVPPASKDVSVAVAAVRIHSVPRKAVCAPSLHGLWVERKWLLAPRVAVTRGALAGTTGPELFAWTVELERTGCLPPNEAFRLAENIVDALPLELARRQQLLRGRTDLRSVNSLQVVSPVMRPGGSGSLAELRSVTQGANPAVLEAEVTANPAVIGYEIDWYDVVPREGGPGHRIAPRSAEIHIGDRVEHPGLPSLNRFQFMPDARWYELFMMTKVSTNDFDFVVFSAGSSGELHSRDSVFQTDAAAFMKVENPASFAVLPHGSGINAFIRVRVNGVWTDLARGSLVRQAITGVDPRTALARLKVLKLHDGKVYPVEWDRGGEQILSFGLEGGEEISW